MICVIVFIFINICATTYIHIYRRPRVGRRGDAGRGVVVDRGVAGGRSGEGRGRLQVGLRHGTAGLGVVEGRLPVVNIRVLGGRNHRPQRSPRASPSLGFLFREEEVED